MSGSIRTFAERHLDPGDRLAEILFGLIMVLTITLGAGVALKDDPGFARELLIAAVGCNIAWGIIDGAFYIMASLLERGRRARLVAAVKAAPDEPAALAIIGRALDDRLEGLVAGDDRLRVYALVREQALKADPVPVRVEREDVIGALACSWLVIAATIPAVIPFALFDRALTALRVSNAVLLAMLFLAGVAWGRHAGVNRWMAGLTFLGAGVVMVAIAIALGG